MEVHRPGDAPSFLRLAGPLLERDEARNQLPLGIAGTLVRTPKAHDVVRFWVAGPDGLELIAFGTSDGGMDAELVQPDAASDVRLTD